MGIRICSFMLVVFCGVTLTTAIENETGIAAVLPSSIADLESRLIEHFSAKFDELEQRYERKTALLERKLQETVDKLRGYETNMETLTKELEVTKARLAEVEDRLHDDMTNEEVVKGALKHIPDIQNPKEKVPKRRNAADTKRLLAAPSGPVITADAVAFTATLSKGASELGLEHTIPFDAVILNAGDAFDPLLHVFTCPVTGIYVFMTAVLAEIHENTVTDIVLNGNPLVTAYSAGSTGGHGYDQGFNLVITTCSAGDRVWVQMHAHQGTTLHDGGFSSFSGFRLH